MPAAAAADAAAAPDDALTAFWRELVSAALRGAQDRSAPLPAAPPDLAPLLGAPTGERYLLDAAAMLWQLAAAESPHLPAGVRPHPPTQPLPSAQAAAESTLREILHTAGTTHWPERRILLLREYLGLCRLHRRPLPAWLLPRVLDAAVEHPDLAADLQAVLVLGGQLEFAQSRPSWRDISAPADTAPGTLPATELTGKLRNTALPEIERRAALGELALRLQEPYARWLARLAQRVVQLVETANGPALEVTPLHPELHGDRLPAVLLPHLPPGLVPRETGLQRAYSLLTLVPPSAWLAPSPGGARRPLDAAQFTLALTRAEQAHGLAYAFGQALRRHSARGMARELAQLYVNGGDDLRALLDTYQVPRSLAGVQLSPAEVRHLTQVLRQGTPLNAGSPAVELLLHLEPLPTALFPAAARALLQGLAQLSKSAGGSSGGSAYPLQFALERCALVVAPLPDLEPLRRRHASLPADSPAGVAWQRALSLLLFRQGMHHALEPVPPADIIR